MHALKKWFQSHSFQIHVIALSLMAISSALLFLAAKSERILLIWMLLGLFMIGNIVELAGR